MFILARSRTLCPRIFFQNLNEADMPYKFIEARVGDHSGVAAELHGDPLSWLTSGVLDKGDVFSGLIYKWLHYDVRRKYWVSTTFSSLEITTVCVDEDFRECNSDRLYLNKTFYDGKGNILIDRTKHYFYRMQGLFRNLRPVYKHTAQAMYLQYVDSHWVVTGSYSPSGSNDRAYFRVKDLALRPEYVTSTWSVHYVNGWHDEPSLRLLCRGVTAMSNTCRSKPCDSKATCAYTSGNETLCLCTSGHTGLRCSLKKQCPTPHPKLDTELSFDFLVNRPGDLGVSFCRESYPYFRYYVCVDTSYSTLWSGQGLACDKNYNLFATGEFPLTQATPQLTPTKFDHNKNFSLWFAPITVFLAGPAIVFYFYFRCKVLCRKVDGDGNETGGRSLKAMWRFYSASLFFSFYFCLIFLAGCEMTNCASHSTLFYDWRIMAMVMLGVSAVFVSIEGYYCDELKYLNNIIEDETAWGYLERMRTIPPKINMSVECYNLVPVPGIAYYLDFMYVETTLERGLTFVDHDQFAYDWWVDVSKREMPILKNRVVLVCFEIDSSIVFGDQETVDDLKRQETEMVDRNQHRADYTDYSWSEEIPDLEKHVSAFVDLNVRPFWMSPLFFWIATLLQMSWPYRWILRAKTAKIHYTLMKEIYAGSTLQREEDSMNLVAALTGTGSFGLSEDDRESTGYPMLEMNDLGTGNRTDENDASSPDFIKKIGHGGRFQIVSEPQNPLPTDVPQSSEVDTDQALDNGTIYPECSSTPLPAEAPPRPPKCRF
ncbi:Transmembrane protein 151B [Stylophora pistillata]|uniref:Transmembrane protein 151B n=1 Tax=Stylophora pistillata TaxID=50429 RepID=A0A2B4S7M2_STYPI|nr:Transmembrane protein 151B [Stylophora pistillata]